MGSFEQNFFSLAKYAVDPLASKGRKYEEKEEDSFFIYQTDRNRIINSSAFRRLEYKTQVFINYVGDHYRTRLTHTLEVSQIARMISRKLKLNEDLAECIALAHDIGHPPFGHAGEEALQEVAKEFGGFDHNAHALKILVQLEQQHVGFDGINLTWETLEGIAKHNGPIKGKYATITHPHKTYDNINNQFELKLNSFASLEAQVASISDDIAYINHDIDDGLRAGFITISDLKSLNLIKEIVTEIEKQHPTLSSSKIVNEMMRMLKKKMIEDVLSETKNRIKSFNIQSVDDVRNMSEPIVTFSPNMEKAKNQIKSFLFERIYRHYKVNRITIKTCAIVKQLFETLMEHPNCMPQEWFKKITGKNLQLQAEVIIDYIAGMTDRYAVEEYQKIINPAIY